uniref:Uncharacterized protein n=1 Tax=Neobodo designis TaxID=312471 RepID=A0A7S1W1W0_NEODS|eukprot:CAMPEP_0174827002 /NCGR_PEP_ID=MMETSP1114-20130205/405_1 /TAXON_ID=312471 /ORGANISM="Neobodo designis, Strain CCAP 1951/1" /LENGTH=237 /DNA_ID=CAMNT_0016060589 /DNA_START=40 /DNA_END=753 /DNA_ORIENTATION=+
MTTPGFLLSGGEHAGVQPGSDCEPIAALLLSPHLWTADHVAAWAETESFSPDDILLLRQLSVSGEMLTSGAAVLRERDADLAARILDRWVAYESVVRHLRAVSNAKLSNEDLSSIAANSDGRLQEVQQRLNRAEQDTFAKQGGGSRANTQPLAFSAAGGDGETERLKSTASQLQTFFSATFAGGALEDDAVLETFAEDEDSDVADEAETLHPAVASKTRTEVDDEFDQLIDSSVPHR